MSNFLEKIMRHLKKQEGLSHTQRKESTILKKAGCSNSVQFSSVHFICSVVSESLTPHGLQHARLPSPSTPRACSNSCPSSWWCHPTISSSDVPFSSSCLQSFPASEPFPMSQFFTPGSQSIRVSASALVLQMNIQGIHSSLSPFPLFPHLFAMKWWDQMP